MLVSSEDFIIVVEISVKIDINYYECNGNENEKLEYVEERFFKIEDFFSVIGVSFEVRGVEVVEKLMD